MLPCFIVSTDHPMMVKSTNICTPNSSKPPPRKRPSFTCRDIVQCLELAFLELNPEWERDYILWNNKFASLLWCKLPHYRDVLPTSHHFKNHNTTLPICITNLGLRSPKRTSMLGRLESAKRPTAMTPHIAAAPCTPTAPTGSSIFNLNSSLANTSIHKGAQYLCENERILMQSKGHVVSQQSYQCADETNDQGFMWRNASTSRCGSNEGSQNAIGHVLWSNH